MKVGKMQISGFFFSNTEVIEDAQNLYAEITYDNNDVYKGTVSINQGNMVREKGRYEFSNGDIAEGRFNDNVEGKL